MVKGEWSMGRLLEKMHFVSGNSSFVIFNNQCSILKAVPEMKMLNIQERP
jgi:hypothetical protein